MDSTHVAAAVAREGARETLALALQGLNPNLSVEQRPAFWDVLGERSVENKLDYPSNDETLQAKRRQAGLDGWRLLPWLDSLEPELGGGKPVALLRAVWAQPLVMEADGQIEPVKVPATGVIQNPHDADAQWSAKGHGKQKKEWVGYTGQAAETLPKAEGPIGFITSVVTQRATEGDDPGLPATLAKQAEGGLQRPSELYVDGAYLSASAIQQANDEGWALLGPAPPSASRADLDPAYRIEAFDVCIGERKAICPEGKASRQCSQLVEQKSGKVTYRFEFGGQCRTCPVRSVCVPSAQPHRPLVGGALHDTLQQRRREQQSPEFKHRMHRRNGLAGTLSELVRGQGLRRARDRGFAKVALQNHRIAAACNVKRWLQKLVKAAFCEGSARRFGGVNACWWLPGLRHGVLSGRGANLSGFGLRSRNLFSSAALA